jgi:hypothetical protein
MLRSLKGLQGFDLRAQDGPIGRVDDFFFDDVGWVVRYLVADTRTLLPGKHVLISTEAADPPGDWIQNEVPVRLTSDQIKSSPGVDLAEPVSRQKERELHEHYGWTTYWTEPADPTGAQHEMLTTALEDDGPIVAEDDANVCHLRSAREVRGYRIDATDGEIGHVEELIAEVETWILRYMVVDTRNWLPGRKVLVAPAWINGVSWSDRAVRVDLTRELVRASPEYDPTAPVNRQLEERLYDFYGRPKYWF